MAKPTAPAVHVDATAAGVRAWADLMGRAAFRLRMTDTSRLATVVGDLLDEETQGDHGADNCPGRICPSRTGPDFRCPTELDNGYVDEEAGEHDDGSAAEAHHHCRWCLALALSWDHPEPAAVRLARLVLEGGA